MQHNGTNVAVVASGEMVVKLYLWGIKNPVFFSCPTKLLSIFYFRSKKIIKNEIQKMLSVMKIEDTNK